MAVVKGQRKVKVLKGVQHEDLQAIRIHLDLARTLDRPAQLNVEDPNQKPKAHLHQYLAGYVVSDRDLAPRPARGLQLAHIAAADLEVEQEQEPPPHLILIIMCQISNQRPGETVVTTSID